MSGILYRVGFMIRETGQALDRLGCFIAGNNAYLEEVWRHRTIMNLAVFKPTVPSSSFVAPSAAVVGDVRLGDKSSVWYGCVLRGDGGKITVGNNSNVQDGTVIRTSESYLASNAGNTVIGDSVTIGHHASLTACTIQDETLIGMGAALQEGVIVETGAMVAAGAVVSPGMVVPSGQIWGGNPARYLRDLKPEESRFLKVSADKYSELAALHLKETPKTLEDLVAVAKQRHSH